MKTSQVIALVGPKSGLLDYLRYVFRRFQHDDGLRVATALSYTSLLALVPVAAISLAMLSAFPAFDDVRAQLLLDVYSNVLPETQMEVARHFEALVGNAEKLTAVGIVGLALTAVLLLSTVVQAMNRIWRVPRPRNFATRMIVYWSILTLGPLIFGASLTVTGMLFRNGDGIDTWTADLPAITYLLPLALETAGFGLLYLVVPNARVHWRHALIGGISAALLFEGLKNGFGLYLAHSAGYQTIYGALAALPILLLWLYAVWAVLVFGAEVAASIPEWRDARVDETPSQLSAERRLVVAMALLARLREVHRAGERVKEKRLLSDIPAAPSVASAVLRQLADADLALALGRGRWTLGRDLATLPLADLMAALRLTVDGERLPSARRGLEWSDTLRAAIDDARTASDRSLAASVADILDGDLAAHGVAPAVGQA